MDCDAVQLVHLVKLVNRDKAAVGQHHGTRLQPPLACAVQGPLVHNMAAKARASDAASAACAAGWRTEASPLTSSVSAARSRFRQE